MELNSTQTCWFFLQNIGSFKHVNANIEQETAPFVPKQGVENVKIEIVVNMFEGHFTKTFRRTKAYNCG